MNQLHCMLLIGTLIFGGIALASINEHESDARKAPSTMNKNPCATPTPDPDPE